MKDYLKLAEIADQILGVADEDDDKLVVLLDELDESVRFDLINSDFLNAHQVFYYYFRTEPEEIVTDRLMLEPASSLKNGVFIDEYGILELYFTTRNNYPEIYIYDGDQELKSFVGKDAYRKAVLFSEEYDY
ncbi:hypothetical protein F1737_03805 [Methanoplanus sp. FWC-SCC4]|uniref:Uncharacterized protein n=1 Tax=Methanochimaera problematica TaxID=2609417 RepID=A0AA97FBL1_9EURY|nr:hypothetical protein [Methanoplanus sp. FWC-SCC4]WOF15882.1 hypothetical protein F1737_03805 [Methanoplanus sp. FWC-SCC4]